MGPTLLSVRSASKRFGDVVALETVDLDIHEGEIIGLVGSNGAGKDNIASSPFRVYRPTEEMFCWPMGHKLNMEGNNLALFQKTQVCTHG